jgi:L-amino acid N-acyltransferase YncA
MIRKAEKKDILALLEIYNHEVRNGVATLDINEKTPGQWTEWFNRHNIKNHPLIEVIEQEVTSVEDGVVTIIATGVLLWQLKLKSSL